MKKNLLITFHPLTVEKNVTQAQFKNVLAVLDELEETQLIFTKANADTGGRVINRMIDQYVAVHLDKAAVYVSLGQLKYLSLLQYVDGVVGNSSSGIIEVPSFKIGTINVGDRQQGRIFGKSIISCQPVSHDIRRALNVLYSKKFQQRFKKVTNPYGDGKTAPRIKKILRNFKLRSLKKPFFIVDYKL